jgi:hypothetical protein
MNIIWNRTSRKGIENEDPNKVVNGVATYKYVVIEGQVTIFAAALGKKYVTRELEDEIKERVLAEIDNDLQQNEDVADEVANDVDTKLLSKLPKKVQPLVEALYKDSEGYWIHLVLTHLFVSTDAHTEHALTLAELRKACGKANIAEV